MCAHSHVAVSLVNVEMNGRHMYTRPDKSLGLRIELRALETTSFI